MKNLSKSFQKITEVTNGKMVGGFSGALNKFNNNLISSNKNDGQCVVVNNCVAGSNCATSCSIPWPTK